jgi:hypothetical protein
MGIYTGLSDPHAAEEFVRKWLVFWLGFSGFITGLVISIKYKYELHTIITPRIGMKYHGTDFSTNSETDEINGVIAYIELIGLSHKQVHFYLWCSDASRTGRGKQHLELRIGKGLHRFLTRTERHRLPVLLFRWDRIPFPFIECLLPYQQHQDHLISGEQFLINISAFGEMEPVHLQLRCWCEDKKFRVEEVMPMENLDSLHKRAAVDFDF